MDKSEHHIVVTDRNSRVRTLLLRELQAEGYRVTGVSDAYTLLQLLLDKEVIDLLILDPDISGYRSAKIESRLSAGPQFPIILHALSESSDRGPSRIAARVEKIGELDTLMNAVRSTLASHSALNPEDRRQGHV